MTKALPWQIRKAQIAGEVSFYYIVISVHEDEAIVCDLETCEPWLWNIYTIEEDELL